MVGGKVVRCGGGVGEGEGVVWVGGKIARCGAEKGGVRGSVWLWGGR